MQSQTVQSPAVVLYVIQGLLLALAVLFGMVAARAVHRPMPWRFWFWPAETLSGAGLFAGVLLVTPVRAAPVALGVAAGLGVVFGALTGASAGLFAAGGRLVLRRTGVSQFLLATSYALLAAAGWFAPKPFISAALCAAALATGLVAGDDVSRALKGAFWSRKVRRIAMAPPYQPEAVASEVPATHATPGSSPLDARPEWARRLADDIERPKS